MQSIIDYVLHIDSDFIKDIVPAYDSKNPLIEYFLAPFNDSTSNQPTHGIPEITDVNMIDNYCKLMAELGTFTSVSFIQYFKDQIDNINCDIINIKTLVHNCYLRKNEGMMINQSLTDLSNDIKQVIKSSVLINDGAKSIVPIYYDKEVFPYCRNINRDEETIFDTFYNFTPTPTLTGIISDRLTSYGIVNPNFFIFTIIDITDDAITNDPPTPPYINLNTFNNEIRVNIKGRNPTKDQVSAALHKLLTNISAYDFYKNNDDVNNALGLSAPSNNTTLVDLNKQIDIIRNMIMNYNSLTLIGSLESTDKLHSLTYNSTCSYTSNKSTNLYPNFRLEVSPFNSTTGKPYATIEEFNQAELSAIAAKNKYLKYKTKYLELKNQSTNL